MKRSAMIRVVFGGEEHHGWLPAGASKPPPTEEKEVLLEVTLEADGDGYLLCWAPAPGEAVGHLPPFAGDLWYETLESACASAREDFGVSWS
jgi:hypothetical protein